MNLNHTTITMKFALKLIVLSIICCSATLNLSAQQSAERAFNYLQAIMGPHEQVSQVNMLFFRCAVHCQDPAQVESYRQELEKLLTTSIEAVERMPDFEEDASLRNESATILKSQLASCQQDYLELNANYAGVNSNADAIEAYYALLEEAERKQAAETERFEQAYQTFADKHGIQLMESTMESEVEFANRVNAYYRSLNMPTLPLQSGMARVMEAVQRSNAQGLTDANAELQEAVTKAKAKVSALEPFAEDDAFRQATLAYIKVLEEASSSHLPAMAKYLSSQKGEDLNAYNAAVAFFNNSLNPAVQKLNEAQDAFLKKHIPEPPKGQKRI